VRIALIMPFPSDCGQCGTTTGNAADAAAEGDEDSTSSLILALSSPCPNTWFGVADAAAVYQQHGACLLQLPHAEFQNILGRMHEWCKDNAWQFIDPEWLKNQTRSDVPEEQAKRFSMNSWDNFKDKDWKDFSNMVMAFLQPFLRSILRCDYELHKLGGDTVLAQTHARQGIHGDGVTRRPHRGTENWCKYLTASIAVHDIAWDCAPLVFVGKVDMMRYASAVPPPRGTEPTLWHQRRMCLKRGQVFLRDPRVWHAGSPNETQTDRYMPAMVFKCT